MKSRFFFDDFLLFLRWKDITSKFSSMKKIIFSLIIAISSFAIANAQLTDVVTGLNSPQRLLLDGNTLYFTDANSIQKIDITVSSPTPEVVIAGLATPEGMALEGNDLYVAEFGAGRISKIDLSVPTPIREDFATGLNTPNFLLLDGNFLYYSDNNSDVVARFDITSTTPTAEVVATSVINFNPTGLAISGDILYMAQGNANRISTVDVTSGNTSPTGLVAGLSRPLGMRIVKDVIYVTEFTGNEITSYDLNGNPPMLANVVSGVLEPRDIALNSTTLFIIEGGADKISKIENILGVSEESEPTIALFPNPASNYLKIAGLTEPSAFTIYTVQGSELWSGITGPLDEIDIARLSSGTYFIRIEQMPAITFIKK